MENNISKEEFEKKYDVFLNQLYDIDSGHFHKLKTYGGKTEFGIFRNKNSVYVKAITKKQTTMTISKNQLVDVLFNNKKYLYSSYEPVIIDYIINDKLSDLSELCEYGDYYSSKVSIEEYKSNNLKTKNIMLYGAPGVGKTHNYKRLITMIENGDDEKTIFDTISKNETTDDFDNSIFETIKKDKRVEFVTFHQSYSYEDFIEGFRPNKNGKIELEDGIFKEICLNAIVYKDHYSDDDLSFINNSIFKITFSQYLNEMVTNNLVINLQNGSQLYIKKYEKNKINIEIINKFSIVENFTLFYLDLKQTYFRENKLANNSIITKFYYCLEIIKDFILKEEKYKYLNEFTKHKQHNFYIVIDEINRGNISKIFGELITLIEEDKRDSYEVTLPYSKEKFKIPSNLYIIATMNSTDKSIATIDIALRRRFTFLKMKPNIDLVPKIAQELFTKLNDHIEKAINEDYKLGHSYFMKIHNDEDLEFVKEYKIKPLLEEYFYGDDTNYKEAIAMLGLKEND